MQLPLCNQTKDGGRALSHGVRTVGSFRFVDSMFIGELFHDGVLILSDFLNSLNRERVNDARSSV